MAQQQSAQQTPGPWYVLVYSNGTGWRETVQHRDSPQLYPERAFNTELGHGQAEADARNAAIAKAGAQ